jgi:hypothetical protein
MNPTMTMNSSCTRAESARHAAPRHGKPDGERCAADFQRMLRDKDSASDDDDEVDARADSTASQDASASRQTSDDKPCRTPLGGRTGARLGCASDDGEGQERAPASTLLSQLPQPALTQALGAQQAAQACAALDAPPRTMIDPPVAALFDTQLTGPDAPGAAQSFEVSVNERMGVPLSMLVTPPGAVQAGSGWVLSFTSNNLNPAILKRHSGRLDERLRSRSLASGPVHIEHDDDAAV